MSDSVSQGDTLILILSSGLGDAP